MNTSLQITSLTHSQFSNAVQVVLDADLDTKEEIEHHLEHLDANFVAIIEGRVVGVIGWYQDNVHYADAAMGDKFPGEDAYWVGFFAVNKNYQGEGIGSALLEKLEEAVKAKGANALYVSSVPETKSYYEQKGFKLVCEGEINGNKKYFLVKHL